MSSVKEIVVPDIGGAEGVEVIELHVAAGEEVSAEDALITLESDKATMDVPSPETGKVKEFKVNVGDKVSEGDLIALIELMQASRATTVEETPLPAKAPQSEEKAPQATAATIEETVPDIGDFDAVEVIEVMVSAGDSVDVDEPLITLESDKATMDIPATHAGTVNDVKIAVGDKVSVGDVILTLSTAGAASTAAPEDKSQAELEAPQAKHQSQSAAQTPAPKAPAQEKSQPLKSQTGIHAGPAVRKYARILGVDLAQVKDTGPRGRILKEDVEAFVKTALTDKTASTSSGGFSLPEMPKIDFSKFGEVEIQPLNKIKKLTGANMQRNWVVVPHVTQFDEADITELERFRKNQKAAAEEKGVKLTMVSFLMKAVVGALKTHPQFNSSLDASGENLVLKKYFHIGVAVDTPNGLLVPVVRDVDKKGLFDIAEELGHISVKAREKGLMPGEMQGSCFTISSLGGVGGTAFTPIVNAPDVAILGVSRSSMKPVYKDEAFVPRLMLPLSLSYDHRVIDGADAARFTSTLAMLLSDIRKLLL